MSDELHNPERDKADLILGMSVAVGSGDLPAAKKLASDHPDILDFHTGSGRSWMHLAAEKGQAEMIRWLAKEDVSPDEEDREGLFPLWRALVQSNSYDAVKALLESGADVHKPFVGSSPLVELVTKPLFRASTVTLAPLASLLVDHGAVVDKPDASGRTPLFFCVTSKRTDVAIMLMERGADPFSEINKGLLDKARKEGFDDVVDDVMAFAQAQAAKSIFHDADAQASVKPLI